MPTEEYPWLAKYTAGVAATLTSAAILALARHFKFNRYTATSLAIGLAFILVCLWSYLITGESLALLPWVWRPLFTPVPLWAALLALAAGLLAVPTFRFLYPPPRTHNLYYAIYPFQGLKWQLQPSLDGERTIALCPRNACTNELEVNEPQFGAALFSCTRCGFNKYFKHSTETIYDEARKEHSRRLRLHKQL